MRKNRGPSEYEDRQVILLKKIMDYVMKYSPYYRWKYKGFNPQDLRSLEDFAQLPFTDPEELNQWGRWMLCVPQDEVWRIVTLHSSGTSTGIGKRVCFTQEDQESTLEFFAQGLLAMGLCPGSAMFVLFPCKRPGSVGELLCRAGNCLGLKVYPREFVSNLEDAAGFVRRVRPDCVLGLPGQVLALAQMTSGMRISSVLLSADYIPAGLRQRIAALWKSKVYEHYGMTEMGFAGGMTSNPGEGYWLRQSDLYFEIVDQSGLPVPAETSGEVVFTSLTAQAMPFIRYKTGDTAAWMRGDCNLSGHMDRVKGRLREGMRCPDDWLLTTAALDDVVFAEGNVIHYAAEYHTGLLRLKLCMPDDEIWHVPAGRLENILKSHGVRIALEYDTLSAYTFLEQFGKKQIKEARL